MKIMSLGAYILQNQAVNLFLVHIFQSCKFVVSVIFSIVRKLFAIILCVCVCACMHFILTKQGKRKKEREKVTVFRSVYHI